MSVGSSTLGTRIVTQIGIVVRDIDATAEAYAQFLGLPKPGVVVTDTFDKTNMRLYGSPSTARAKLAFFELDNLVIELIEPDSEPSVWREFLDTKGEGVHHIAFVVKNLPDKLQRLATLGIQEVQSGDFTGGRYSYVESTPQLKVLLELLEQDEK